MKRNTQLEAARSTGKLISALDEILNDDVNEKLTAYARRKNISTRKALNVILGDWLDTIGDADSVVLPEVVELLQNGSAFMTLHDE